MNDKVETNTSTRPVNAKRLSEDDLRETLRQAELLKRTAGSKIPVISAGSAASLTSFLSNLAQREELAKQRTAETRVDRLVSKPWAKHLTRAQQEAILAKKPALSSQHVEGDELIVVVKKQIDTEKRALTFVPDAPVQSRKHIIEKLDAQIAVQSGDAWKQRLKQISRPAKIERVSEDQRVQLHDEDCAEEESEVSVSSAEDSLQSEAESDVTGAPELDELIDQSTQILESVAQTVKEKLSEEDDGEARMLFIDDEAVTSESEMHSSDEEFIDEAAIERELKESKFIAEDDDGNHLDGHDEMLRKLRQQEDERQEEYLMQRFNIHRSNRLPLQLDVGTDDSKQTAIKTGLLGLKDFDFEDASDDGHILTEEEEDKEDDFLNASDGQVEDINLSSEHQHALEDLVRLSSDVHILQDAHKQRSFKVKQASNEPRKPSSLLNLIGSAGSQ